MNVLADTQILIWSLDINSPLSIYQKEILQDTHNRVVISYISLMELVIKRAVGKLPGFVPDIDEVATLWQQNGYEIIPLTNQHLSTYTMVPFFKEHTDPFDRFIIAIAKAENFSIMTADRKFSLYKPFIDLL